MLSLVELKKQINYKKIIMQNHKDKKKLFLIVVGIIIFIIMLYGIEPNSSIIRNRYWYCWNNFTLKRFLRGTDPHRYGRPVIGDHLCTYEELKTK